MLSGTRSVVATIYNPSLVALLPSLLGKEVYMDFTVAEAPAAV